jgi:hypothetical protein
MIATNTHWAMINRKGSKGMNSNPKLARYSTVKKTLVRIRRSPTHQHDIKITSAKTVINVGHLVLHLAGLEYRL